MTEELSGSGREAWLILNIFMICSRKRFECDTGELYFTRRSD